MASQIQKNFRARKSFAKLEAGHRDPEPDRHPEASYDKFLQIDVPLDKREDIGLQGVFRSVFPIKDFNGTSELVFVSYNLEKPKYDVDECRQRGMTFAAPIKVDDPARSSGTSTRRRACSRSATSRSRRSTSARSR